MASEKPESTPHGRRSCLVVVGLLLLASVVFIALGPRCMFRALWDGGGDLLVRGRVERVDGTPLADARITLILHPGAPGYQLYLASVDRALDPLPSRTSVRQPDATTRKASNEIGITRTDAQGAFGVVLGLRFGGTTGEPGIPPRYGGIRAVIVEAEGYEAAYVSAPAGGWSYDPAYLLAGSYDSVGRLDLGVIGLRPEDGGRGGD